MIHALQLAYQLGFAKVADSFGVYKDRRSRRMPGRVCGTTGRDHLLATRAIGTFLTILSDAISHIVRRVSDSPSGTLPSQVFTPRRRAAPSIISPTCQVLS